MFGWLFGKKKKQETKEEKIKLFDHDDLAAEFFSMYTVEQVIFLRDLGVIRAGIVVEYAQPTLAVKVLAEWKSENQAPLTSYEFRRRMFDLVEAKNKPKIRAVFQQIFRDLEEVDSYVESLEALYERTK